MALSSVLLSPADVRFDLASLQRSTVAAAALNALELPQQESSGIFLETVLTVPYDDVTLVAGAKHTLSEADEPPPVSSAAFLRP